MVESFPKVNGKTYHCPENSLSDDHIVFKLKDAHTLSEKQELSITNINQVPTVVTNNNDVLLDGPYDTMLNAGRPRYFKSIWKLPWNLSFSLVRSRRPLKVLAKILVVRKLLYTGQIFFGT